MFAPLLSKALAEEVGFLIENITGDAVRVIGTKGRHGRTEWIVQRYTGTEWVEG